MAAGFESGHAYGKAVRTVKSCVGTTWCRYGVGDSVGFAVRIENRYKGIRAPHKLKSAVSGCVRECAEAQSKDFGLIATEKGWNLYVGGNGGAKPRHADLLASDLDEETAIRLIDRFLAFYIRTADKLTRTSVWLGKLEGGLEHLRDVVVHDRLGIAAELERQMQALVDGYECEWSAVVRDPERRRAFRSFVDESAPVPAADLGLGAATDPSVGIELVEERGQRRPADRPRGERGEAAPERPPTIAERSELATVATAAETLAAAPRRWVRVGAVADFPREGGATVRHGRSEIAVFHFASRGAWYATQNVCPHERALVLARGIVGDAGGTPKVACPLHKKTFSLATGRCLTGGAADVATFPVRVRDGAVELELPPAEVLDAALATPAVRSAAGRTAPTLAPARRGGRGGGVAGGAPSVRT